MLALSPLAHAFNCRSRVASIFKLGLFSNRLLVLAVLVSGAIHMMALLVPGLQPVFRTDHTWTLTEVAVTLGLSLLPVPAFELADWRIMHARQTGDREKERLFTEVHRVMMAMECFGADALYVLSDEDPFHDRKE